MTRQLDLAFDDASAVCSDVSDLLDRLPAEQAMPVLASLVSERLAAVGPQHAHELFGLFTADIVERLNRLLQAIRQNGH